jgi:hypothetical protein
MRNAYYVLRIEKKCQILNADIQNRARARDAHTTRSPYRNFTLIKQRANPRSRTASTQKPEPTKIVKFWWSKKKSNNFCFFVLIFFDFYKL